MGVGSFLVFVGIMVVVMMLDENVKYDFGMVDIFLFKVKDMYVGMWRYKEELGVGIDFYIGLIV